MKKNSSLPLWVMCIVIQFRIFRKVTSTFTKPRAVFQHCCATFTLSCRFFWCSDVWGLTDTTTEVPLFLKLGRSQNAPFLWSENCCCIWAKQRRKKPTAYDARAILKVIPVDFWLCGNGEKSCPKHWVPQCTCGKDTVGSGYFIFS